MNYTKNESVFGFKIRWFIENCCEIKLPNGKTILIDPMLVKEVKNPDCVWESRFCSGFDVNDLEGCDYVVITHMHGDHIYNLKDVWDKFQPTILVNGYSAYTLSVNYDIPPGAFIPTSDNSTYNLGDFKLTMLPGRHTRPVSMKTFKGGRDLFGDDDVACMEGVMGSLYNNNFLISLPNGLNIAMDSGFFESDLSHWEDYRPNLLLRHKERDPQVHVDNMAACISRSGAQYIMTLCQQGEAAIEDKTAATNAKLAEMGYPGRAINPEPGKWYTVSLGFMQE